MNDKQIQAFLTIAQMGSMNRAAEKLYISQPALKKRMDALEEELSVVLLRRDSGGCTLTQAGQVFMEGVRPLYAQLEVVIEKTKRVTERKSLRVCTMPDISMRNQDKLMLDFMHENPDVSAEQVPLPTSRWFRAIEEGSADLCYSFYDQSKLAVYKKRGVNFYPIGGRGKTVCVMSSHHPLAGKKRIAAEDLLGQAVYAGPLLYGYSGLKEFALERGIDLRCDESAGKRYEMISRCEAGAVYIHPKGYSESLKPLAVIVFSDFYCHSGFVYGKDENGLAARYIRFCESRL